MRGGEERKPLVRRTKQVPALLVVPKAYDRPDGRTLYYTPGRGVSVAVQPGLLSDLYRYVNDGGVQLLGIVERVTKIVEGVDDRPPREFPDNIDEATIETTKQAILAACLLVKAGHVLVLAGGAGACLVYERIAQTGGSH